MSDISFVFILLNIKIYYIKMFKLRMLSPNAPRVVNNVKYFSIRYDVTQQVEFIFGLTVNHKTSSVEC